MVGFLHSLDIIIDVLHEETNWGRSLRQNLKEVECSANRNSYNMVSIQPELWLMIQFPGSMHLNLHLKLLRPTKLNVELFMRQTKF